MAPAIPISLSAVNLNFSAAASDLPNANTKSVLLTEALNVSSASAHIEAAIAVESVPSDSTGAWKSIRPN